MVVTVTHGPADRSRVGTVVGEAVEAEEVRVAHGHVMVPPYLTAGNDPPRPGRGRLGRGK